MSRIIAGVALAAALLVPAPAAAQAQVDIVRPAEGEIVSHGQQPRLLAEGTFTPPAPLHVTRTFYLRRDDCASDDDNPHMALRAGSDEWPCGEMHSGTPTDVFMLLWPDFGWAEFPAAEGLPVVLDTGEQVTGTLALIADVPIGRAKVEIQLRSDRGVVGGTTVERVLNGQWEYEVPFAFDVAESLDRETVQSLSFAFRVRGIGARNGFVRFDGESLVHVPIIDMGLLEVSTSSTFLDEHSTYPAVIDGAWETNRLLTPPVGEQALYARVTQNGRTIAHAATAFTVVP